MRTLIIGGTHGDEATGIEFVHSLNYLKANYDASLFQDFETLIANPAAVAARRRYLETDLNRSFAACIPLSLEERRAQELKPILETYDRIIEFHNTHAYSSTSTITTCFPTREQVRIARHFGFGRMLFIKPESESGAPTRSLSSCRPRQTVSFEVSTADAAKYPTAYLLEKAATLHLAPTIREKTNLYIYEGCSVSRSTLLRLELPLQEFACFEELTEHQRRKLDLGNNQFVPVLLGEPAYGADFGFWLARVAEMDLDKMQETES